MTNPMITIHNAETGKIIEREMTKTEADQLAADKELSKAKATAEATKAAEKAALLAKLGITEQEAALLLGGN
jgi:hypothetical protein